MQGLLADVNVQGNLPHLEHLLTALNPRPDLDAMNLRLVTFNDLGIPSSIDDRPLWNLCQEQGWVLFTDNRNKDGPDSLDSRRCSTPACAGPPSCSHDWQERQAQSRPHLCRESCDGYRGAPLRHRMRRVPRPTSDLGATLERLTFVLHTARQRSVELRSPRPAWPSLARQACEDGPIPSQA